MKYLKPIILVVFLLYAGAVTMTVAAGSLLSGDISPLIALLIAVIPLYLWSKKGFTLSTDGIKQNQEINEYKAFLKILLLTLLVYCIYWFGQFPGYFSPDNYQQYPQAIGLAPFNDWHPVIHTLLTFKLPLQISGRLSYTIFVQYLWFSMGFSYMITQMIKLKCPKVLVVLSIVYVLLNPQLEIFVFYPVKDTAMTTACMFMFGMALELLFGNKNAENEPLFLLGFGISTLLSAKLRHNGLLFALPFFTLILFLGIKKKKNRITAAGILIILFVSLKILYSILGVEQPGRRTVETAGLPATVWCNVMKEEPESVSRETQELLYTLADKETYANYECGSFNSIKWRGFDQDKFNELTYGEIIRITAECLVKAPKASITALVKLTDLVWGIGGAVRMDEPGIVGSCYPTEQSPDNIVFKICNKIHLGIRYLAEHSRLYIILFGSYGLMMLVLMIPAMYHLKNGNIKPLVMLIPLFCYNFGTMLLLSADDYHFFMFNIPLFLPMVYMSGRMKY